jgi:hypothetical protein
MNRLTPKPTRPTAMTGVTMTSERQVVVPGLAKFSRCFENRESNVCRLGREHPAAFIDPMQGLECADSKWARTELPLPSHADV